MYKGNHQLVIWRFLWPHSILQLEKNKKKNLKLFYKEGVVNIDILIDVISYEFNI